jgi:hypothetical protein
MTTIGTSASGTTGFAPEHFSAHLINNPIKPYSGPPSLTSSFAAAKPQSLLVLDVECIDQPETEVPQVSGSGCGSQTPTRPNRFNTGKQYNCSTAPSNLQQYGDFATEIDIGGGVVAAALGWSNRWWTRWTIIYKMSGSPRFMSSVSHTY